VLATAAALLAIAGCARTKAPAPLERGFTQHRWPAGQTPFGVAIADLNGDGRLDLAVTNVTSDRLAMLLGTGGGGFEYQPGPLVGRVGRGLVATDLNGDGHVDLVVAGVELNSIILLLGDGAGGFERRVRAARLAPFNVAVADLDNDGHLDVAVANESNIAALEGRGDVSLFFGNGAGDVAPQVTLEAGSCPSDVKVGDLNADGQLDLAVVNWKSTNVSFFWGDGRGGFSRATNVAYGGVSAYTLAFGDMDADGRPDVVLGDLGGTIYILHNDGGGHFTPARWFAAAPGLRSLILVDLNGDGRLDIATANTGADSVSVLLATSGGDFAAPLHIPVGQLPRTIAAADLNGDGRPDLVVANSSSNDISVLINNGLER
jgi:hypothetical protein